MATPREQLQAMRCLHEGWDGYGAAAPQGKVIDLALEFADLIEAMLMKSTPSPAVLHVSPTRMGGILIEWEDGATEFRVLPKPINEDAGHSEIQSDQARLDDHADRKRPAKAFQFLPEESARS